MTEYPYGEAYQVKIAALVARDPSFLPNYKDVVDPDFFEDVNLSTIVRLTIRHMEHFRELPTRDTLFEAVSQFTKSFKDADTLLRALYDCIDRVFHADISDARSLKERVIQFGKLQSIKTEMISAIEELEKPDANPDKIQARLVNAGRIGSGAGDSGIDLVTAMPKLRSMVEASSTYAKRKKISTGIDMLDSALHGGPGRGEIHVILAPPAGGKSVFLLNMGHNAVLDSHFVLHITIGDLDEEDTLLRYCSRFTGVPMLSLIEGNQYAEYNEKARQIINRHPNLHIKYYPAGKPSTDTIASYVYDQISMKGRNPDVIIVDYADKISMPRGDNTYLGMSDIYSDLQNLAREVDAVLWTGSQIQRQATRGNAFITQDSIDKSWEKAALADGIYSLNQSMEMYDKGFAVIYCAKIRRGRTNQQIPVFTNYEMALLGQGAWPETEKDS